MLSRSLQISLKDLAHRTTKDKQHFYYISLGSLTELQNQLIIARDLKYLNREKFDIIANKAVVVSKLIRGLIKSA